MPKQRLRFVHGAARIDLRHHLVDEVDGAKNVAGLLVMKAQLACHSGDLVTVALFEPLADASMQKLASRRRDSTREHLSIESVPKLILATARAVRPFDVLTTLQKTRAARQVLA